MISSISNNRFAAQQTDYSRKPPVAPTDVSNQDAQQYHALKTDNSASTGDKKTQELSESDLKVISELKQRDAEVKAHEAAHLTAAGGIATGGASFEYQQGPDGVRYAVGGEVNIDTSAVPGDPAATLQKPTPSGEPPWRRLNLPVRICKLQRVPPQWRPRHKSNCCRKIKTPKMAIRTSSEQ